MLELSADPASIAEVDDTVTTSIDENVSTVTVAITNGKTFADDQTVTLAFAGTAPDADYTLDPADADSNTAGHQVTLPVGDSSVEVSLTAVDNNVLDDDRAVEVTGSLDGVDFGDTQTITITDDEMANDATLSALTVNDGTSDLTLAPAFVSDTFAYTTDVASSVEEVTLTAERTNTGASVSMVTLDGSAIADADFTDGITVPSLVVGDNVIVVTVTAEDGSTTQTYTVTVTREAATTTAPAIVTGGVQVTSMPKATPDTYGLGETIAITVAFDNAVTVDTSGGTPRIQFRLDGAVNRWAAYSRGSGGTDLVFTYVVQSGDMDVNGIWLEENFLQLQSGTISAAADNTVAATLTYAQPGLQTQHKVDGSLTTTLSTDATLSALTVNDGTTDLTLAPAFASEAFDYTTDVASSVSEVTLTAETTDTGASVSAVTLGGSTIADTDFTDGMITVPSLVEGANVIVVTVTAEDGSTTQTYTVTVTRGETANTFELSLMGPASVNEGETAKFALTLDLAHSADIFVRYTVGGLAIAGVDYIEPSGEVLILADTTSAMIEISILTDNQLDPDHTIELTIVSTLTPGATVNFSSTPVTVVIVDTTALAVVRLTASPVTVDEDAGATTVTVTAELDGDPFPAATEVTVSVGANGDSAAAGTDYESVSDFTVMIPADATSGSESFELTPVNDAVAEGAEEISIEGSVSGASRLDVIGAVVTIADDEGPVTVTVESDGAVKEGEMATFTVELSAELPERLRMTVSSRAGTAVSPEDYAELSEVLLRFPSGTTEQKVTVQTAQDDLVEGEERFSVVVARYPGGLIPASPVSAEGVIEDDDTPSTEVTLTASPVTVDEDAGATTVTVMAELDEDPFPAATEVTVSVGANGDSAAAGRTTSRCPTSR